MPASAKSVQEPGTKFVQSVLEDLIGHRIDFGTAVGRLLAEMGRGQRILVIDENLLSLDPELAAMGYTTKKIDLGAYDAEIERQLSSRILITPNGKHFSDPGDMKRYYYGLIWVTSKTKDEKTGGREDQRRTHDFELRQEPRAGRGGLTMPVPPAGAAQEGRRKQERWFTGRSSEGYWSRSRTATSRCPRP